ncbi:MULTISPECIES: aldose 1-epimerase [unclassified Nocardia]|uniref:aldose epimerase family protein n=1 Tax=unclassified Nocardia TaxID=2637762 RepID=UPI001CE3FD11|nr:MULTISPECIES: aldose 1-epimerase [unclassified Nocardia]
MIDERVVLHAADADLTVDPANGCRLSSLRVGDIELLRQGPRYGAFPMVPWCGRTALGRFDNHGTVVQLPINNPPHAIHGTGRDTAWTVLRRDDRSAAFAYELTDPWPYGGRVTQTVELSADSLTLTMRVESAAESFPAQAGWHPWFNRDLGAGAPARIEFTPAWQEERGADHLPTGRRIAPRPGPWDDCFGMPGGVEITLSWPGVLELTVTSPAEWVVVFDEQEAAVCVEPQSGPPNGLNTLPRPVTPESPLTMRTNWSWRKL